jgi:hypothetical protein
MHAELARELEQGVPAPLASIFEALPDEPIKASALPEPVSAPKGWLRNGEIKRVIAKVLAAATGPLPIADIHRAVERLLGHDVLKDSVGWRLAAGARGRKPCFERVSCGVCRLAGTSVCGVSLTSTPLD